MPHKPDPDLLLRLENAISNIPRRQREIFLAHRVDGMSYAEIARRTGSSVGQVQRQMAKALWKIGKQMDGERLPWWERWF